MTETGATAASILNGTFASLSTQIHPHATKTPATNTTIAGEKGLFFEKKLIRSLYIISLSTEKISDSTH